MGRTAQVQGAKRHQRKTPVEVSASCETISGPALKRLARRGGVISISKASFNNVRNIMSNFIAPLINNAVIYADARRRKTICVNDVKKALLIQGKRLYGY